MYTHNIDPVIFKLGPFEPRWYGLVYVITFLLVYYFLKKNKSKLNISDAQAESLLLRIVLGVIIGARLFLVLVWEPSYYISNPLKIFALWEGGMSLHGGIIGAFIAGYTYCRKKSISPAKLADVLVLPGMIGLMFGRIANFINAEIIGTITTVPWCIDFGDSLCRHPVQIYAAIGRFFLVLFIIYLIKTRKHLKEGKLFWLTMLIMGIGRFVIDFLRQDPRLFGLSLGQYLSILLSLLSIIILYRYYHKKGE